MNLRSTEPHRVMMPLERGASVERAAARTGRRTQPDTYMIRVKVSVSRSGYKHLAGHFISFGWTNADGCTTPTDGRSLGWGCSFDATSTTLGGHHHRHKCDVCGLFCRSESVVCAMPATQRKENTACRVAARRTLPRNTMPPEANFADRSTMHPLATPPNAQ